MRSGLWARTACRRSQQSDTKPLEAKYWTFTIWPWREVVPVALVIVVSEKVELGLWVLFKNPHLFHLGPLWRKFLAIPVSTDPHKVPCWDFPRRRDELKAMLHMGIIKESYNDWSNLLVFDGLFWLCEVNITSEFDTHPRAMLWWTVWLVRLSSFLSDAGFNQGKLVDSLDSKLPRKKWLVPIYLGCTNMSPFCLVCLGPQWYFIDGGGELQLSSCRLPRLNQANGK